MLDLDGITLGKYLSGPGVSLSPNSYLLSYLAPILKPLLLLKVFPKTYDPGPISDAVFGFVISEYIGQVLGPHP